VVVNGTVVVIVDGTEEVVVAAVPPHAHQTNTASPTNMGEALGVPGRGRAVRTLRP
jgi:hypothetical protein